MSKHTDLILLINKIEEACDVRQLDYQGIKYWPYLRNKICISNLFPVKSTEIQEKGISKNKSTKIRTLNLLLKSASELVRDRNGSSSIHKASMLYLTHSTCRSQLNGEAVDTFFHPLLSWISQSADSIQCFGLEYRPSNEYRIPRGEPTMYIQTRINMWGILSYFKVGYKRVQMQADILCDIANMVEQSGYDSSCISEYLIRRDMEFMISAAGFFTKILRAVQPKIVLVVTYYSQVGMALMFAAKELGIQTFDLQHGIQGRGHYAYSRFASVPDNGWNLLPSIFLNWTYKDADNIESWGNGIHKSRVLGFPWHDYVKNNIECDRYLELVRSQSRAMAAKSIVLVSLQPNKDNSDYLSELLSAIHSPRLSDVLWLVRLHPSMFSEREELSQIFMLPNVEMDESTTTPLPIVLDAVSLHVTKNSSVVIEAAAQGISSLVAEDCDLYNEYEESGFVERVRLNESITEAVARKISQIGTRDSNNARVLAVDARQEFMQLLTECGLSQTQFGDGI